MAHLGQGDRGRTALSRRSARPGAERGDQRELAAAINAIAQLHRMEGDLDKAEPLYEEVLRLARELGDRESIAIGLLNLAMVGISRASGDRAREMLLAVLAIAGGDRLEASWTKRYGSLCRSCRAEYRLGGGGRFYGAAEAQSAQTDCIADPADEAFLEPLLTKAQAALGTEPFAAPKTPAAAYPMKQRSLKRAPGSSVRARPSRSR